MAAISLKGSECHTNGELPAIGSAAPDFILTTGELKDVSLVDYKGKKKLLNIVPSLDTEVCATSAKTFNESIQGKDNIVAITVSADLPFAMSRFCSAETIENITTLSMMRSHDFASDYGVLIGDGPLAGLAARAIVVIDENDKVSYTQLVTEITNEPDYDKALSALGLR